MHSGELNQRIEIQSAAETVNDSGERIVTWSTAAKRWARVVTSGREFMAAQQRVQRLSHVFETHYTSANAGQRLLWKGRTLEIVAAYDPDGQQRRTLLVCTENA